MSGEKTKPLGRCNSGYPLTSSGTFAFRFRSPQSKYNEGNWSNLRKKVLMKLTADQERAIQNGQAVPVTVRGEACVLLRKDVFERGEELDYGPWTPEEI